MTNQSNDGSNDTKLFLPQLLTEKDSFRILLIAIVSFLLAVLFFLEIVVWYTGGSLYVLFLTGLPVLIVTVGFLLVGIKHIVQGLYKSALLMILAIPFLILAFSLPSRLFAYDLDYYGFTRDIAYHIKFTLHEKQYLEEIKTTLPDEKGYRYKSFLWGGAQGDGSELVYDGSDALGSTAPPQTLGWWRKTWDIKVAKENEERANANANAAEEVCPYHVYKIKMHVYVVRFTCG